MVINAIVSNKVQQDSAPGKISQYHLKALSDSGETNQ